ncbi:MAG: hypothetical protein IT567_03475 [Alphaproteobacteria bacterium]|nr:hypothetical protein [Alphaproteobacteria bacterium]
MPRTLLFLLLTTLCVLSTPAFATCVVGGCSGQLCVSDNPEGAGGISTCEWREEYGCYKAHGECTEQPDGQCGWTQTPALQSCLKDPSKLEKRSDR